MSDHGILRYLSFSAETQSRLKQAFKLALSLVLYYWLALIMNWDVLQYGALAIVIVSLSTTGATIETGMLRVVGTIAGVLFGFLVIGCFSQDRWAMMLAFAGYLAVLGYFLQASRYQYAWYAAAFIPLVVWGDNYPDFQSTFYFGTFRFLTTVVGILIYTMVDLVFWPKSAGRQLWPVGNELCEDLLTQFRNGRAELGQATAAGPSASLSTRIVGNMTKVVSTLQQAYLDTPELASRRKVWEAWRIQIRELVDALNGWRETVPDCQHQDMALLWPEMNASLVLIDDRLKRIGELWEQLPKSDEASGDDAHLLAPIPFELNREAISKTPHMELAVLLSFTRQMQELERTSRQMLVTMRMLNGLDSARGLRVPSEFRQFVGRSRWNPTHFVRALFPPTAFVVAYLFWIYVNPPGGAKLAMMTGIFSIMILRTPMNPLTLCILMVLSMLLAVAPIYWLVMPALTSGGQLLALIFAYAFVFGYLGGRSPALKAGPMIQFVTCVGISNQQVYSFQSVVTGALMITLAGIVVAMVYFMFRSLQPEKALLKTVRRFFRGCAGITRAFEPGAAADPGRSIRQRYFVSLVRPAPAEIESARKSIQFNLQPDNDPEDVQRLQDGMQGIVYRLEAMERAHDKIAITSNESICSLRKLSGQAREATAQVFDQWARLPRYENPETQWESLDRLGENVQQQIADVQIARRQGAVDESLLVDMYSFLGSIRGLLNAIGSTQTAINQINWNQLAANRF